MVPVVFVWLLLAIQLSELPPSTFKSLFWLLIQEFACGEPEMISLFVSFQKMGSSWPNDPILLRL